MTCFFSPVRRLAPLAGLALGALLLAGCGDGTRQALGLGRSVPDEFAVVSRAPLSMPPDFTLRPPRPGAARPQEPELRDRAASVVFGAGGVSLGGAARLAAPQAGSVGEAVLLSQAGAAQADPDIRRKVDEETAQLAVADRRLIDRLLFFWQEPEPPGTIVDASREAQRLRENAAAGRPLTEGETPVIERRRRAPLEGLFN